MASAQCISSGRLIERSYSQIDHALPLATIGIDQTALSLSSRPLTPVAKLSKSFTRMVLSFAKSVEDLKAIKEDPERGLMPRKVTESRVSWVACTVAETSPQGLYVSGNLLP